MYDLHLKTTCDGCGSSSDLYGSNCKHMTLCLSCGKTMAENQSKCYDCGIVISRLIREYNVRASTSHDRTYYIGRFPTGMPAFSKKKNAESKWLLHKGLQGRQMTDAVREKYKNKPWNLEDASGLQYQGHLEGSQSANYFLLMMQGKEFVAIPAGSWYNFHKLPQYKQLSLEEAEEKMKNRRRTADGYERWMMKAANIGSAAFGDVEKIDMIKESGEGGGRRKASLDEDDDLWSDKGEEDEEEEAARKNKLGLGKKGTDDEEEGSHNRLDFDDDEAEKGDDWEHEEIFTDDDEAPGNAEENEDLAAEVPAPPEIKQDDEDEDESNEEEGTKLSKSGKELKKLLGKAAGMNESDAEDDDEDDDMEDDEVSLSPVLAPKPKQKDIKEEPLETTPTKNSIGPAKGASSQLKSVKAKRKTSDDAKSSISPPAKKLKTEQDLKPLPIKEEPTTVLSKAAPQKVPLPSPNPGTQPVGSVTEEEIRAVLLQNTPVTTQDLVAKFKARLRSPEDKSAFADILRRISKIQKTNGPNYVVLREK